MYYYIIEVPPNYNLVRLQTKLKSILGDLNINGEMAIASSARSAEELAQIGLAKGYSTIVAIGDDYLVNRLASLVANTPASLGVIPVNLSPQLADVFASSDIKHACQVLKARPTHLISLGHITPNKYFLSDAEVLADSPTQIALEIDNHYRLDAKTSQIIITSDLEIEFSTRPSPQKSSWFGGFKKQSTSAQTHLHCESVRLFTDHPLNILVSGSEIAKTPCEIKKQPGILKIISDHANM